MNELPKRKHIRIEDYDYSTPGVQTRAVGICFHIFVPNEALP